MADRIPVKAKYAPGSPVDVIALQEFEPTDTIPLSIISGFSAGVTAELALNSIGTLGDVNVPTPANDEVLTFNSTSGNWEASTSPGSIAAIWGNITGTLSDQLDLQAALDLKADQSSLDAHTGDATIHFTEASIDHLNILNIGINSHAAIDTHIAHIGNPHSVTQAQVGLGNVDNTADIDKPLSTASIAALGDKADKIITFTSSDPQLITITNPTLADDVTLTLNSNTANGLVKLDALGLVPIALLPETNRTYLGLYDASTNTLPPDSTTKGDFYIINVSGTINLSPDEIGPPASTAVVPGDQIVWNPGAPGFWIYIPDVSAPISANTVQYDNVTSGLIGTNLQDTTDELKVLIDGKKLSELIDVDVLGSPAITNGQVLIWNSTTSLWLPSDMITSVAWGTITGTLSDQLDLQTELDLKTNQTDFLSHTGDATIHFTESSIDHLNILNIGINSHAAIDTHLADGTIHFTEGSIDHLNILNIGALSHNQIDTHINNTALPHSAIDILFNDTVVAGGFTEVQSVLDFFDVQIGLRETAATGVIEGGVVAMASPTTIDITAGAGEIVDGYTDRRNPTRINVSWVTTLGFVINMPAQSGVQIIYVDAVGNITAQATSLTPTQRRNLVQLAFVNYSAGAITSVSQAGILSNEVGNTLYDWIYFTNMDDRVRGMGIKPVAAVLSIWGDTGELFSPGINIAVDITNQNVKSFAAVGSAATPAVFDVLFADGTVQAAAQTVVPNYFESAPGVITALPGNDATIHYVYRTIANKILLQLGTNQYGTAQRARDQLQLDLTNHIAFVGSETALLSSQIYVEGTATDFNNPNDAGIISTIGAGGASSGVQVTNYLDLTDVVDTSYAGQAGNVPTVNVSETGLEFTTISGGADELVKVSATDTTAGYLSNELVAGSNITLTVLNPGGDEKLEIKYDRGGQPYIATIGGNDMVVYDDTTRANKTLSSETEVLYFAESVVADNDWMQIQHATDADSGYVMPFNGTIVSVAMHCENTNGVAKGIDFYFNGISQGLVAAFTGGVNEQVSDTTLNTDFVAGDKIRLRGSAAGGQIQDTNIQLRVKWRL